MSGIHTYPTDEKDRHDLEGVECCCEPLVEFINPANGETYEHGPMVTHNRLDKTGAGGWSTKSIKGEEVC